MSAFDMKRLLGTDYDWQLGALCADFTISEWPQID